MMKNILKLLPILAFSLPTLGNAQDYSDENLPVKCGPAVEILKTAKEKFNEEPIMTWVDPRYGRYVLTSNADGSSISVLLFVKGVEDGICVISVGDQLMKFDSKKPTL